MAPPATAVVNPNETREQRFARAFEGIEEFLSKDGRFSKLEEKVEAVAKNQDEHSLDLRAAQEAIEKNKAATEALAKRIKNFKGGLYFPGLEDLEFDIFLACAAIANCIKNPSANQRQIFEQCGARREFDIMKEVERQHEPALRVYNPGQFKTAQQVGDDQLGGYFIPDQVLSSDLIVPIYRKAKWINLSGMEGGETNIRVIEGLLGASVEIPKALSGVVAFWVGEEDAIAESAMTGGVIEFKPKKLGCLVKITESMALLQGVGFDNMLRTDMIEALAKKLDETVPYGAGGKVPLGIAKVPGEIKIFQAKQDGSGNDISGVVDPATVTDWPSGTLDQEGIEKMKLAFEEDDIDLDDSFRIISSPRYFTWLKTLRLKQFATQPAIEAGFVIGDGIIRDAALTERIGRFVRTNTVPSNLLPGASIGGATTNADAKHTDVFAGNFNQVILGRWAGIQITSDEGKWKFASGHVHLRAVLHADVQVRQGRAVMLSPNAKVRA